ncbi:hypothetical protein [Rathayibacter sp. VKM Ac-2927]|uniref:hypothetical protein n=1 Tax=Rathayibacter sp. VKM Ac-2927 TaxID=2929478 RepID=UPI001FB2561C|nr:hypothetical protein [Rathayibacter sp. VKM Ac-2927]MCJ1688635.1 hypothetical protein [Rathayibacter sp. VKM Ac-2927]
MGTQKGLYRDAATAALASAQSDEATAVRADAGKTYDGSKRREAFAASLEDKDISAEDVKARLRADVDQARPADEVLHSPSHTAREKSSLTFTTSWQRQRGWGVAPASSYSSKSD